MIKRWKIVCEVNMCADKEVEIIVKANTKRKAEEMAVKNLHKKGYFHIKLLYCREVV